MPVGSNVPFYASSYSSFHSQPFPFSPFHDNLILSSGICGQSLLGEAKSYNCWRTAGTHDPIQRVKFMNEPKLYLLKGDNWAW